jgi:hypothetical protein
MRKIWSLITNRGKTSFTIATTLMLMLLTAVGSTASAAVLDFEDLYPGHEYGGLIPTGYQGFSWSSSSWWLTKYLEPNTGFEYGTIDSVSLFTGYADDLSLTDADGAFDFFGAFITSAFDSDEQVVVEGWRDGLQVYQEEITTYNDQAYWFDFSFTNIDTLWFRPPSLGSPIVIDDVTLTATAVPVPATVLLLGAGLVGIVGFRRKNNKHNV